MARRWAPTDLSRYQSSNNDFAHRSLADLIEARDLYHAYLSRHPNVVGTAVSRYRIRKGDSWPNSSRHVHGTGERTLTNSEVRPYSWPCILVFVSQWEKPEDFAQRPGERVPSTLFMPNGARVPVCVIAAPREQRTEIEARDISYPINNIGPGHPVFVRVQGQTYVATVGCLVSDGHKIYALTNRHVTGPVGAEVYSRTGSAEHRIGVSADQHLTRLPLTALYPAFPGRDTFVNIDIGLIEIDDLSSWTAQVPGIGIVGPMADFSDANLSLSLVGCDVRGVGAASGDMRGEIQALLYRYKTSGGFEYVADLLIGPRSDDANSKSADQPQFMTLPGDSGTMWMLEPERAAKKKKRRTEGGKNEAYLPVAIQWGRNMLRSAGKAEPQGFALATLLSRVCALLEVDLVRDWNLDQTDTWGALGHFSIAARSRVALSDRHPKLVTLMDNNSGIISRSDDEMLEGDFAGMGSEDFVPLADVPDFFWKPRVAKQGFARPWEGPNHFADMDQKNPDGKTLLDLTLDDSFFNPDAWDAFYDSVTDLLTGEAIAQKHRGLLPFRAWQIFDGMAGFVSDGQADKFVCAAGVLTHYLGDACQPLHISYLHDGDPTRPVTHTFSKGKKAGTSEERPLGQGVHTAYEDKMVFANRKEILKALQKTLPVQEKELISTGREAARLTVDLMRKTFELIPPADIVETFVGVGSTGKAASDALWEAFGKKTIQAMKNGAHLIALLWESAWVVGDGDRKISRTSALRENEAMAIVADPKFLPSLPIEKIGKALTGR